MESIYQISVQGIDGKDLKMSEFKGKVMLIVNVASKCGFTPQYKGLEDLFIRYQERGFVILGFPSNDFLGQEPGSDEEIKTFCSLTYGVTFPLFSKIKVRGEDAHPLYTYLTDIKTDPDFSGNISWNFNKFLIDKNGRIINRFDSAVKPDDKKLVEAIENALN